MTIKRITNTSLEANRVILRPQVTYTVSGSDITGSMPLIPNPSPNIKVLSEVTPDNGPMNGFQVNLIDHVNRISLDMKDSSVNPTRDIKLYLDHLVPSSSLPSKNSKQFDMVIENVPGINFLESSTNLILVSLYLIQAV